MTAHLDIASATQGHHYVVTASGEIDLASAPNLEAMLTEASELPSVVVDLSAVSFIDSTGLRVLISSHERATAGNQRFAIVAVEGPVTKLLSITGVDSWLNVFDSLDGAVVDA